MSLSFKRILTNDQITRSRLHSAAEKSIKFGGKEYPIVEMTVGSLFHQADGRQRSHEHVSC